MKDYVYHVRYHDENLGTFTEEDFVKFDRGDDSHQFMMTITDPEATKMGDKEMEFLVSTENLMDLRDGKTVLSGTFTIEPKGEEIDSFWGDALNSVLGD